MTLIKQFEAENDIFDVYVIPFSENDMCNKHKPLATALQVAPNTTKVPTLHCLLKHLKKSIGLLCLQVTNKALENNGKKYFSSVEYSL